MNGLLLALADKKEIDVSAHLDVATVVALVGIGLLIKFFAVRPELWRRLWFDRVDPRAGACMRIFFGLVVFVTFFDLLKPSGPLEYSVARYLFTDDGLWLTDMARKNYGGELKTLWDPEHGLATMGDLFAVIYGKFCIFHFKSDPPFVFTMYGIMLAALLGMVVGWRTRTMTIIAWILVENFYRYSPIFYTGGDTVVRIFLFLGMFSRWGEAYSLDSWRRRRKAILGKARAVPSLRRIPAWPFRLMALQLCIIYCATGMLKSGSTWADGTALYYALNLDHFYRFPQQYPVIIAHYLHVLPNMSIFVRWWEVLFPLVAIGAALNCFEREKANGTWPKAHVVRRIHSYVVFAAAWGCGAYLLGLGAHYYLPKGAIPMVPPGSRIAAFMALGLAVPVVAVGAYVVLRKLTPEITSFVRKWPMGKRFWLGFGFLMHIGIDVGMNVGTFAEVMMAVYLCWLSGEEIEAFWRYIYSQPSKVGEDGRPLRTARVFRVFDMIWDRAWRYRKTGKRFVVVHHPGDATVRRVALLRIWDLGGRLAFEPNEDMEPGVLGVRPPGSTEVAKGARAAAMLTKIFPGLLWLRPFRRLLPAGYLAAMILRQRA